MATGSACGGQGLFELVRPSQGRRVVTRAMLASWVRDVTVYCA
ncbi:MAG: hypothetical protein WCK89_12205 [bacterium]